MSPLFQGEAMTYGHFVSGWRGGSYGHFSLNDTAEETSRMSEAMAI